MKSRISYTKFIIVTESVLLLLLIVWLCSRRVGPPAPPHPPGPPLPMPVTVLKGIVKSYAGNPEGDIDKLVLEAGGPTYLLRFPPHTAQEVMRDAPAGTAVIVNALGGKNAGADTQQLDLAVLKNGDGGTILDIHTIGPPPPGGEEIVVTGTPTGFRRDEKDRVTSFVLDSNLVTLPPYIRESVVPLLLPAKKVTVKGFRRGPGGFVNSSGLRIVRPYAIGISGVEYIMQ